MSVKTLRRDKRLARLRTLRELRAVADRQTEELKRLQESTRRLRGYSQ